LVVFIVSIIAASEPPYFTSLSLQAPHHGTIRFKPQLLTSSIDNGTFWLFVRKHVPGDYFGISIASQEELAKVFGLVEKN
jgi:hypothetical protein